MKILTININKGGTGKTTLSHNLAEYLAKDNRVLLMDFDDSCNLTGRYNVTPKEENTIISLFDKEYVEPIKVRENLDLICSYYGVDLLKERQNGRRRREYTLGKWIAKNHEKLSENYDYIIIDTENDEAILTINALIVSDVVLGIAEPSKDAVEALIKLKYFVNDLNSDFDSETKLFYLGNRINFSENMSKDFIEALERKEEYLGCIPRRTLIGDDIAVFNNPKVDKKLKKELESLFIKIKNELDKENE